MNIRLSFFLIIISTAILGACESAPTETLEQPTQPSEASATPTALPTLTETPAPTPSKVLISEVLAGAQGNNNYDFIELYNPGTQVPYNLKGATLWYQLADGKEEIQVYAWDTHSLIPPHGHYLLAREGEDFGLVADALIDVPMVPQRGSLQIRSESGDVLDSLIWGEGSQVFAEGDAAVAMQNGVSLERAPGGEAGNASDGDNNQTDFTLQDKPQPQNSGSLTTPMSDGYLALSFEAPAVVEPGQSFEYLITVINQTEQDVNDIDVQLPLPLAFEILELATGVDIVDQPMYWELPQIVETHQILVWSLDGLAAGESKMATLVVKAPWTYLTTVINNYSVHAADGSQVSFGGPVFIDVAGGAIPIGIARGFANQEIVVEGVATMYTGGYYAGSGNAKFYLEDETGGIQVWVDDGEGDVNVQLGDRVRVQGLLLVYRGAMELAPTPEGVEILEKGTLSSRWPATQVALEEAATDMQNLPGKLVQTQGTVARLEEFTYSYEIDLVDEAGHLVNVYIDKLTNINVDAVNSGEAYQISGVIEVLDANQRMYPRIQEDLTKIYPPELFLDVDAPNTILAGEAFVVQLTAINHTP